MKTGIQSAVENRSDVGSVSAAEVFDDAADQFTHALRRGENPCIDEFAAAHPRVADKIRLLFPMLAMMETADSSAEMLPRCSDPFPQEQPKRLGDFLIEREIGRGGMGVVYQALQESLGRRVALKLLPQSSLDQKSAQRFDQEARLVANLVHSNIVPVYGIGKHEGYAYFVMQYIEGQSLDRVLVELKKLRHPEKVLTTNDSVDSLDSVDSGKLSRSVLSLLNPLDTSKTDKAKPGESGTDVQAAGIDTGTMRRDQTSASGTFASEPGLAQPDSHYWINVARVGMQIASALGYAHQQKILHRDIKPSNMIMDEAGSVWVTDFGLARSFESDRLTRTGEIVGTLRYMPPEQMAGQSDVRGDVYGLGLTLYEMLTLHPANDESDHRRLIAQVTDGVHIAPRKIDSRIPRDLETIILKSIEREPEKRYQSADALHADLKRFVCGEPIHARRISTIERIVKWAKRRPTVAALALLATMFACLGVAGITWKWREADHNFREAQIQSDAREVYFSKALDAVRQLLTRVGNTTLADTPQMTRVREQLLNDALGFYVDFAQEAGDDPGLRREMGLVHRQIGDIQAKLGKANEAAAAYLLSSETFKKLFADFPDETEYLFDQLFTRTHYANYLAQSDNIETSERELDKIVNTLEQMERKGFGEKQLAAWNLAKASAHYGRAIGYQITRNNNLIIKELETALEFYANVPRKYRNALVNGEHAACLQSLATKVLVFDQVERSIKLRDQAIDIVQGILEERPDSADSRNELANLLQEKSGLLAQNGKLAEAAKNLKLEIAERRILIMEFPHSPRLRQDLARGLSILSGVKSSLGDSREALRLGEESVRITRQLVEDHPETLVFRQELAYVSQMMGTTCLRDPNDESRKQAAEYYQTAYETLQELIAQSPANLNYARSLGMAARNLSAALVRDNRDPERAHSLLQEAVEVFAELTESEPGNTDFVYQLSYTRLNFGHMLIDSDLLAAEETMQLACNSLRRLIDLQSGNPRYQLQLTRAYGGLANVQFQLGQNETLESTLRLANETATEVVTSFGPNPQFVDYLTRSQNHLGHHLKTVGKLDEAEKLFQAALEYREKMIKDHGTNANRKIQLASALCNRSWLNAYWRKGDEQNLQSAIDDAKRATSLDPEGSENWTCLAHAYIRQDKHLMALDVLNKSESENEPDQMGRAALRAIALWNVGQERDARKALNVAIAFRESDVLDANFQAKRYERENIRLVYEALDLIEPEVTEQNVDDQMP